MTRCALKRCKKQFVPTVPWQRFCKKQCADQASQNNRATLMKAGRHAMNGAGRP